jgi:hypothetical protein
VSLLVLSSEFLRTVPEEENLFYCILEEISVLVVEALSHTTMLTLRCACFRVLFLLTSLALPSTVFAQSTTTTAQPSANPTASSTYNVFSAIASSSSNGGSDPGGSPEPSGYANPDAAGASGSSQSAITLNTGDQIAIGVVVGLVVIIGLTSAVLFYLAKKRQWEVRASLRRSARRVTTAFKAKTPIKSNFSRKDRGVIRIDPPSSSAQGKITDRSKRSGGILKEAKPRPEVSKTARVDRDVEKGFGTQTKIETLPKPSPAPKAAAPKTSFDMDSPLKRNEVGGEGAGKEGGGRWMKMLWRK